MAMSDANRRALDDIDKFIGKVSRGMNRTFRDSITDMADRLIDTTPTYFEHEPTSGNTRANWNISADSPDTSYDANDTDKQGTNTLNQIKSEIKAYKLPKVEIIYMSNSSPSMESLEFGLYPHGGRGSYNTQTDTWEKRSIGGFSTQAPSGIIVVNALDWDNIVYKKSKEIMK